jgi:putative DNA primase/helicase
MRIPEYKRDLKLTEKLRAELPGILAWALKGFKEWQHHGLEVPPEVREATEGYRAEMDTFAGFLENCCVEKTGVKSGARKLYERFTKWCEESGEERVGEKTFSEKLAARGYEKRRSGMGGSIEWHGLAISV